MAGDRKATNTVDGSVRPSPVGAVLHAPVLYDVLLSLAMLGREGVFREKVLALPGLQPGEAVLDVGCGTGTLAIAAKRRVGPTGTVYGIDASPEMIVRAQTKARKAGLEVVLENAMAQALPFPDAQFDAVLSTIMLHHLPRKARLQCAVEMRRVLKPDGRVLAVDCGLPAREKKGLFAHFHRGHVKLRDIVDLLTEAGLNRVQSGSMGFRDLHFALAKVADVSNR